MRVISIVLLVLGVALWVRPATAAGIALVIANEDYDHIPDARGADSVLDTISALEVAGFDVFSGYNLTTEEMRAQLAGAFGQMQRDGAARFVVVLAGHFVHARSGTWLLGVDADAPGLALADSAGLRLDGVMEIAAIAQENALIWLAPAELRRPAQHSGAALEAGLPARLLVPQGVGVVRGPASEVAAGLGRTLAPGTLLSDVVDGARDLAGEGTISPLVPFLPTGFAPVARADRQAWAAAQAENTEDAYRAYLSAFPNGLNAQAARNAIAELRNTPERIEDRLDLTRDERRAIQRDLVTLGYNTRGIDGIFGPGTRSAIRGWQEQSGLEATSFLTRAQVLQLAAQATRRAAEIEAEERARREALEREDRAFWEATGAGTDEPGLRAYLDRFPRGIFASLARERLAAIEQAAAEDRLRQDRMDWRRAQRLDSIDGYEAYLADWPEGAFAAEARARLQALRPAPSPEDQARARDRDAEAALHLGAPARILIERRLAQMGFDPGAINGAFDADTREAIADAQEEFGLVPTGFVTQELVNRMLGDALRGFLR
ncbi:MAG: peptidoglycan-binding protein [Rhodobacteraceae bacterium]|nr:peptidoglycan-binding protein [Paracoccaceae bacterium]